MVPLIELTVPWEEGLEAAHKRKQAKYSDLAAECREAGWRAVACPGAGRRRAINLTSRLSHSHQHHVSHMMVHTAAVWLFQFSETRVTSADLEGLLYSQSSFRIVWFHLLKSCLTFALTRSQHTSPSLHCKCVRDQYGRGQQTQLLVCCV